MSEVDDHQPRGVDVNIRASMQGFEYDEITDAVVARSPRKVLDWGAGHGQITKRLTERGIDVVAFDYRDGEPHRVVPMEQFPELEVHTSGEPVKLPFADGEFDLVLSLGVLEHVHDPVGSLRELHRVLEPGGHLLVYKLPNRFSYLERIAKQLGWYYHGKLPHDRIYTVERAVGLLEANGFAVEDVKLTNLLPLTLTHPVVQANAERLWTVNRALERVPGVKHLATNVECVARRTEHAFG